MDFWIGLLLPIPIFFDVALGHVGIVSGFEIEGATAVPIGIINILLMGRRAMQLPGRFLKRDKGSAASLVFLIVAATLWLLACLALVLEGTTAAIFATQWCLPLVAFIYGKGVATDPEWRKSLTSGLLAGIIVSVIYIALAAVASGITHVAASGRFDPLNPPLPGMYQVANYTPSGLFFAGCLVLGLAAEMPYPRLARILGATSILMAATFFGAREVLVNTVLVGLIAIVLATKRRFGPILIPLAASLVLLVAFVGPTSVPASVERSQISLEALIQGGGIEGASGGRVGIARERGLGLFSGEQTVWGDLLHGSPEARQFGRQSSHNSYLELTVDFGIFGLLAALGLAALFVWSGLSALGLVWKNGVRRPSRETCIWIGGAVLGAALVSCMVRLPLTQPYTALILYSCLGILVGTIGKFPGITSADSP